MNKIETKQLKCALRRILDGVGAGGVDSYLETVRQVDHYVKEKALPKKLAHYLARRSYLKALEYLKDEAVDLSLDG
ncbi:MAG: hypothetical protein CML08_04000 [Puniceicoccaceae bacterium]|nr:hypothetical protein [Puniceicoccaceae bacterium]